MRRKYGNQKIDRDGYTFASRLEGAVYELLKIRAMAGEIKILQTQDSIYLTRARILYIPDFKCQDAKTGEIFFVEAKGFETARWPTIKKLWKHYGEGKLEIWKGTWQRPYLDEIIVPVNYAENDREEPKS